MIRLYDTKSREKRDFVPVNGNKVGMYVCGPTVYNYIHIGNARTFISFDTIRRYLMFRGYDVTFVQNVTDVDDKIINKAREEGRTAAEVAQEFTEAFIADMRAAGVLDPDIRPKATEEIDTMINLVQKLIDKGHAYEVDGDVYFAVRSYDGYGQLSGRNIDEMESGHRELRADGQGLEDRKRDPLDFALWKAAKPGEPSWTSPWGEGRPGWHIECSAMSEKYLHLPFDIHGGGADLAFPHHENERAQSEAACGCTFSNYWMHGGMLQINSEKMSKSLGNFLLLRDVLKTTKPSVLRMLMLQTHYRSPLDFSDERLKEADAALCRIANCIKNINWIIQNPAEEANEWNRDDFARAYTAMRKGFIEAMDDDFNTAGALGCIFSFIAEANTILQDAQIPAEEVECLQVSIDSIVELMGVLGITLECDSCCCAEDADELVVLANQFTGACLTSAEEATTALLERRAAARKEKDFATADAIRNALTELGYVIEDTPQGARLSKSE
ncbi:MAG: cysteine--tRNA ligase [Anaerotardibacter sp.]